MPVPASPRDVFQRLIDGVAGGRWDELPGLYAEHAHVTHPLAVPARPPLRGRAQLRAHFAAAAAMPVRLRAENVVVHQTADPEVIVAEFDYRGMATTTGRPFTVSNVFVMRVRDGLILTSRDYANHAALTEALA